VLVILLLERGEWKPSRILLFFFLIYSALTVRIGVHRALGGGSEAGAWNV